jgi:hypothetical protein
MAKGIKELSQTNPANEADNSEDEDGDVSGNQSVKPVSPVNSGEGEKSGASLEQKPPVKIEKSELSKAIAGRLFIATSYGWVFGSRSTGKWSAKGGMSDLTVGYKWRSFAKAYDAFGTYRYAPISVQGEQDFQSYRGIWEVHYVGGKIARQIKNILTFGTLEAGYVVSHVLSTDGLLEKSNVQERGFSLALGGGADFKLLDQVAVGPRLNVSLGSVRTVQLAGAASFAF